MIIMKIYIMIPRLRVIYIASLNQNHKAMTIAALKAGKGVLCEKPLGLNVEENIGDDRNGPKAKLFFNGGYVVSF